MAMPTSDQDQSVYGTGFLTHRVLTTTNVLDFFMQDQDVFGSKPEMRRMKEGWDPPFFLQSLDIKSPFEQRIRQDLAS